MFQSGPSRSRSESSLRPLSRHRRRFLCLDLDAGAAKVGKEPKVPVSSQSKTASNRYWDQLCDSPQT
jgi:hypothetical protein